MLAFLDPIRGTDYLSLLLRLLIAALCGAAIGLERSVRNRPAGFRTHTLVCLSGAVAAITGHFIFLGLHLPGDVTRISGQVITGLGFIGAGAILVTRNITIKGLTTAAGLWTAGIVGIAVGSGFYEGGLLATALVLLTELVFIRLDKRIRPAPQYELVLRFDDPKVLSRATALCREQNMTVRDVVVRSVSEGAAFTACVEIQGNAAPGPLWEQLRSIPGLKSVEGL